MNEQICPKCSSQMKEIQLLTSIMWECGNCLAPALLVDPAPLGDRTAVYMLPEDNPYNLFLTKAALLSECRRSGYRGLVEQVWSNGKVCPKLPQCALTFTFMKDKGEEDVSGSTTFVVGWRKAPHV